MYTSLCVYIYIKSLSNPLFYYAAREATEKKEEAKVELDMKEETKRRKAVTVDFFFLFTASAHTHIMEMRVVLLIFVFKATHYAFVIFLFFLKEEVVIWCS